ncbi:helix-turn-helix domain-containing protein [Streptomyces sp. NBC_01007]|nr:helix-turn-helix domain-containing protein [Streptomyces sp. NBC_01007]
MTRPDRVTTQQEFIQALQELVATTGKSPEDIAKRSDVSGNTVRGVMTGKNWPQLRTVELLVRACGQDPRPWVHAWAPLNDARPQPMRGNNKELREQIDALGAELTGLREQVRSLRDAMEQGEWGDRQREHRMTDAYFTFLTQMPSSDFRRVEFDGVRAPRRNASPTRTYAEPAYEAIDVNSLLGKIQELATVEGLPGLALYLATSQLPLAIATVAVYMAPQGAIHGYAKSDVDAYLAELKACVHRYLRDCTDDQALPADGAVGPGRSA